VLVLPFIRGRTLLSELAASPSSILKITTCNHCPRDDDYQTVSGLFNTLQSLRTVEFLIRTHSKYHTAPSDETLIKIGERIMLRIQSERWVYSLELARDVVMLTAIGRVSVLGNTSSSAMSVVWQAWRHRYRPREYQPYLTYPRRSSIPFGRAYSITHASVFTFGTVSSTWCAACSW